MPTTAEPFSFAEQAAREVRAHVGVTHGPIGHVVRLLESRGIVCTRLPAQTRRVYAFSCAFPGRPVVVLSTEREHIAASRFDTAHELGHLVLHPDEEPGNQALERQANTFAAEFLTPAAEIAGVLPRRADWRRLLDLKAEWGVSIQALLFRARTLGVMSENVYRRSMTELSANGWRLREPGDDGDAEEPILLAKAVALAEQRGLTIEDLAERARLPVDTARLIVAREDKPTVQL